MITPNRFVEKNDSVVFWKCLPAGGWCPMKGEVDPRFTVRFACKCGRAEGYRQQWVASGRTVVAVVWNRDKHRLARWGCALKPGVVAGARAISVAAKIHRVGEICLHVACRANAEAGAGKITRPADIEEQIARSS